MQYILLAISLSMDAFSAAVSYSTLNVSHKSKVVLTSLVGIFHFFMPLLGIMFFTTLSNYINIDYRLVTSVVFLALCFNMLKEYLDKDQEVNYINPALFALLVSIDSFSVSISLVDVMDMYLIIGLLFAFTSAFFTYVGLRVGDYIYKVLGNRSLLLGSFIMFLLAIKVIFLDK